jgi:hypothetical protein
MAKRGPKPKQKMIPGTEPVSFPDLDRTIDNYVEKRDSRMETLQDEVKLKAKLIEQMAEHNLESYKYDGFECVVEPGKMEVKVKRLKTKKEETAEE